MKHTITTYIIAAILLGGSISGAEAATTLSFGGIGLPAVRVEASTTDLHGVYVIDNATGTAKASYEAEASANIVQVQRYGAEGIAYASDVTGVQRDGTTYTWTVGPEDCGFVVNDGGRLHAWWVVNYNRHRLDIHCEINRLRHHFDKAVFRKL